MYKAIIELSYTGTEWRAEIFRNVAPEKTSSGKMVCIVSTGTGDTPAEAVECLCLNPGAMFPPKFELTEEERAQRVVDAAADFKAKTGIDLSV